VPPLPRSQLSSWFASNAVVKQLLLTLQVCIFLLAFTASADDSLEQKKVDKRGLLGLGYGYGHSLAYVPATSYTKVSDRRLEVQDTGERRAGGQTVKELWSTDRCVTAPSDTFVHTWEV